MSQNRTESSEDPPNSRLFVLCGREHTEEDIRASFDQFGEIEDVWVVKDKRSGENKGVVYVKFSKTSSAAHAMEEMNGKSLGNSSRTIKVLVANSRNQGSKRLDGEDEKYVRLFVIIPKEMTEKELQQEFEQYGTIEHVSIIRDKKKKEGKGFGYVKFAKFSEAANAFENADSKYKAVFAEPKPQNNRNSMDGFGGSGGMGNNSRSGGGGGNNGPFGGFNDFGAPPNFGMTGMGGNRNDRRMSSFDSMGMGPFSGGAGNSVGTSTTLYVACSPMVNQVQLWRLFDIIPGLDFCQINGESRDGRNVLYATVVYNNQQSASYARDKLNGFEYPPGERLIVKPGLDFKIDGNSAMDSPFGGGGGGVGGGFNHNNINLENADTFCNVRVPPPAPMADVNSVCQQRCFIVCVSQSIPINILRNVFSRFGGLIDIYLLPNKNCGYAKYTTAASCKQAIETLHGAEICGTRIKVIEAEELGNDDRRKRQRRDD